nr:hypothetical protein [Tanacetum cinerariifolium]
IEGLWLGLGAHTGEAEGSMIRKITGSKVKIRDSVGKIGGWTSLVLSFLAGCTVSLVASVSRSTTGEEVVGIVGPGYVVPLRVVIPFRSSFGLVIILPERVLEPEDKAVEESRVDEPKIDKPELDKLVLGKLEVGFDLELADHSISHPVGVAEDIFVKVGTFHLPADFVVIDFDADPRVPLILKRSFLKTGRALIDVFESELTLQVDAFLALEDDPTSTEVDQSYLDSDGDILLLEAFPNDDLSLPPPNQGNYLLEVRKELKIRKAKSDKSSIDEPPEVKLKDLPPHLEYAFWEGDDKLPVIIMNDLSVEEKTALITVLKSHKRAIA